MRALLRLGQNRPINTVKVGTVLYYMGEAHRAYTVIGIDKDKRVISFQPIKSWYDIGSLNPMNSGITDFGKFAFEPGGIFIERMYGKEIIEWDN